MLLQIFRLLKDWFTDVVIPKVNPSLPPSEDVDTSTQRVYIKLRGTDPQAIIAPASTIDGTQTKRGKLETGKYLPDSIRIWYYAITKVGSPVITCKIYQSGDDGLQADDSVLHTDYQQVGETLTFTDPEAGYIDLHRAKSTVVELIGSLGAGNSLIFHFRLDPGF